MKTMHFRTHVYYKKTIPYIYTLTKNIFIILSKSLLPNSLLKYLLLPKFGINRRKYTGLLTFCHYLHIILNAFLVSSIFTFF